MENILCAKNLTKEFKNVTAVNKVNLEINKGYFYAIMGRSGSGKTTLLSLLGMLDYPTKGELIINSKNIFNLKEAEKSRIRMKEFGFVFQDFHLNPIMKAYENVMLPMYINKEYEDTDIKKKSIKLLELFGLGDRVNHYPSQLSGGEKQRVALARALANDPKCIFADEPTGNLDTASEKIVFDYLRMLVNKGKSVVVVSHNDIILDYADFIYSMNDGILEAQTNEE